ncbi:Dna dependent atpase [Mycena sanguinolenta]|uniref:Dna dependent atpase n=1 Tax=Mycena sanguinolenta TaxID=230812 RepID=A0A8H6ZCK8_9AGAR|nr:Dna dependent atpase [Mycena sanguinolenta]
MSGVQGPVSALTDYLRSTGITATTIARRVATQQVQPEAGPSTARPSARRNNSRRDDDEGYASDNLDEPESPPKKQKVSKAAAAKAKAAMKKKKKDEEDSDEDAYTALSKTMWTNTPKPAVGSFADCATCEKQFTVTKYTMASSSGPGFLCHPCAKAGGKDPFKKPAAPRKRKTPAEKRTVVHIEERSFPTLVTMCIDVIARNIDDVESFGDIGGLNMDAISKALSKNRSLTSENATLFYGAENTKLALYDATNLSPDGFSTLGHLNPNLTSLRLDFCGPLNDTVMESWNKSFPNLVSLELLGPFLVRAEPWIAFLKSHPNLEAFLITQSPRFSLDCLNALVENSKMSLRRLRLREVGKLCDEWLESMAEIANLTYLDLAEPSSSFTDDAVVTVLAAVGANLTHLDLSGHGALTDDVLMHGLDPHVHSLTSLALSHVPELTDAGVGAFFGTFENGGLTRLNLSCNPELGTEALEAIITHSPRLEELNINGFKDVAEAAVNRLAELRDLRKLDVGWCRSVDDWVVKKILEGCRVLGELKVWGCNRVEGKWGQTRRGVKIHGIESQSVL